MLQKLRVFLANFLCGFVMGTADIIPGVSGGTMAWVLGIYERLINVVSALGLPFLILLLKRKWREFYRRADIVFVLPLAAGIISAIAVMVKLFELPNLMRTHPEPVYGLFFGLIAGSVLLLLRHKVQLSFRYAYLLVGAVIGFTLVNIVPTDTADSGIVLFFCGMLAISAMLLPGISGSFILLVLGKYVVVLEAISTMNVAMLLPFCAGCLCGLMLFSRLLRWLLKRFYAAVIWLMGGLLVGSLWMIWPFQDRVYTVIRGKEKLVSSSPILPQSIEGDVMLVIGLAVLGFVVVTAMERLKAKS